MEWLKSFVKNNSFLSMCIPAIINSFSFFSTLIYDLKDGVIDTKELHDLMAMANGPEMVFLIIVIFILREKKK